MLQNYKYEKLKVRDFADLYLKYGRIKTRNHKPYLTYLTKPRVDLKLPNWTSISRRLLVSGKRVLIKTQDKANVVLLEMKASNIPEVDRILKISNKLLRRQVSPKIILSYKEAKKYIGRGTTNRPADENEDTDNEIEEIDQTPKKIVDFVELTDSSDDEPLSKTFKIDNNCQSRLRSSRKTKNFYKCQDEGCDKAFASEASLKKHRLDHIILFQCLHCKRKFMSQKNLSQHQESYHKNKTSKSRKIHNPQLFQCPKKGCYKAFPRRADRDFHRFVHKTARPYFCKVPGCDLKFKTWKELNRHGNVHKTERPFVCPVVSCSQTFKTAAGQRRHNIQHEIHPDVSFTCTFKDCGKVFALEHRRDRHLKVHDKDRPFVCDEPGCGANFRSHDNWRDHKSVHITDRPFVCEVPDCGKAFTNKKIRRLHMKTHAPKPYVDPGPFNCPELNCYKEYKSRQKLYRHIREYHKIDLPRQRRNLNTPDFNSTLPICKRKAPVERPKDEPVHPYKCHVPNCPKPPYLNRLGLKYHMKVAHRIEVKLGDILPNGEISKDRAKKSKPKKTKKVPVYEESEDSSDD